jgi:hypothetical protein
MLAPFVVVDEVAVVVVAKGEGEAGSVPELPDAVDM